MTTWTPTRDLEPLAILARMESRLDLYLKETRMTRAREAVHAPHCDRPEPRRQQIGTWELTRCPTCRATGLRKPTTTDKETR